MENKEKLHIDKGAGAERIKDELSSKCEMVNDIKPLNHLMYTTCQDS